MMLYLQWTYNEKLLAHGIPAKVGSTQPLCTLYNISTCSPSFSLVSEKVLYSIYMIGVYMRLLIHVYQT